MLDAHRSMLSKHQTPALAWSEQVAAQDDPLLAPSPLGDRLGVEYLPNHEFLVSFGGSRRLYSSRFLATVFAPSRVRCCLEDPDDRARTKTDIHGQKTHINAKKTCQTTSEHPYNVHFSAPRHSSGGRYAHSYVRGRWTLCLRPSWPKYACIRYRCVCWIYKRNNCTSFLVGQSYC